ncbi:MAG: hypothetical protein CFH05_01636, partial [Alphaproteobacteria bacterium MarineAlpha3_Bin4]
NLLNHFIRYNLLNHFIRYNLFSRFLLRRYYKYLIFFFRVMMYA